MIEGQLISEILGSAIGGGGSVTVLGLVIRVWYKNHKKQMATMEKNQAAMQRAFTQELKDLKNEIEDKIDVQSEKFEYQMKEQAKEFHHKMEKQEAIMMGNQKLVASLETRIAICEERSGGVKEMRESLESLRDLVITDITKLDSKTEAIFDVLKGKRQLWDKETKSNEV